ncbi:hypothetical protein MKW94_027203 [Papaver nudicaule]|uniref:Uncharacterized protein n=1 Tax=Papaver nudicaule TaxID=74823 RepID=A0AA41S5Q1_PAPNU|nr:hypothetical protein [Papaver nudicaule]
MFKQERKEDGELKKNCALHVCYNMKRLLKGNLGYPEEDITPKINVMRAKLTFKIIDDVDLRREG